MSGEHSWCRFRGVEVVRFVQEAELKGTEKEWSCMKEEKYRR